MTTLLHSRRLLIEALLIVAVAEFGVMLLLPLLATSLGTVATGMLDVLLVVALSAPIFFWRFRSILAGLQPQARRPRMHAGQSHFAMALAAATQILGLVITAAGLWWQSGVLQHSDQTRFDQGLERVQAEVVRRLNQVVYGLKGARGAIAANPQFDRAAFRAYVQTRDLPNEFPGVQAFSFVEPVQRKDLAAFVARERADGAPDFALQTSGSAPDLFVIKYIEPLQPNRAAWGFDLGQDDTRRAAASYAMRTGEPTLSGRVELKQGGGNVAGFLYLLPVYRNADTAQSGDARQRDLLGLLSAPIAVPKLLESVGMVTENQIDFELFDGTEAVPARQVFGQQSLADLAASDGLYAASGEPRFSVTRALYVGSRVLTLRASSNSAFERAQDRSSLVIIGGGGTLVSFLMAMTVWLLAVGRQRARDLADAMTAELDRMAQVVQHTDNAVTIMDREMRIEWVNQGFTRITGYSLQDARGRTPGDLLASGKSDPQAIQTLKDGAQSGVACRVQLINRARDGREYWADTEVQPMISAQGQLLGFMEIGTDISVQKQTQHQLEAAMRDSSALLNTVNVHAIVSSTDAQGRITDVNEAFCRISGYSREELMGQDHRLLNAHHHSPEFWVSLWQTISSGKPWRGEVCNRAKDGSLYWVDSMIAPFVGEDGRIEKYISIRTDITERRLAAEKLRQSEATFAASFQNAATGMAFFSTKGQWLRANPAMCDFLGYSEEQLHEMTFMDTAHPEEWDTDALQMLRLLQGEIPVYQRAKRYVHRDGQTIWGLASVSVVRAEDGEPQFVIAQIVDITARKRAEEALGLSNALMEESQAIAKVGGWELQVDSGALYWTHETYRIYDATPDDYSPTLQASVDCFVPGSRERLQAALQAATEQGQGYDLELQAHTTRGRRIDVRTTCSTTLEQGRVVRLSGIFQDITERKQYERSLKEARERAEQATQSKGQFLANMSHEIRTPMNAVLGMLKLLHKTELSPRQRDYADKTANAARSLLALINDILDFSKVEAGKMALDPQPFSLEQLMRNLAVILSGNVSAAGVDVLFDVDPAVPDVLLSDAMRLQQVLVNLGGNAVKFTAQGQVVVAVRLLQREGERAHVRFSVQDSGIGIAAENQAHIFTGFSQAEASTTRKFGGTGLGLSISQRLVQLLGGTLELHSTLGQGSTFSFTLPLPVVQPVPADLHEELPATAPARRVLVVDANPVARALLARMAQSWGWPVHEAADGAAALALLEAGLHQGQPFEVVYLAWHLPGPDGWAVAARLRQLCAQQQARQPLVLMLSSNSREELGHRTLAEQQLLNGFVVKPFTATTLLHATLESGGAGSGLRRSARNAASQRRLGGMRILVVEDNLINQQVAEELLMAEGALVSLAANGRLGVEAIAAAAAAQAQFHAVLMDLQMPVLDGFAATREVRERLQLPQLPIIAMTANAMASDRAECLAAGMNEHVGKPFDLKQLVDTLLRVSGYQAPVDSTAAAPSLFALAQPAEVPLPLPMAESGALDVAGALERMGGMVALYLRAAHAFADDLPSVLAALQTSLGQGAAPGTPQDAPQDTQQGALLAHTLKGTAATLGATALADAAAQLEACCKAPSDGSSREAAWAQVRQVAAHTQLQLQQTLADLDGTAPAASTALAAQPLADVPALQAALRSLAALLADNDLTALEQFAAQRPTFCALPAALFDALEAALQDLDLQAALHQCEAAQAWLDHSQPPRSDLSRTA